MTVAWALLVLVESVSVGTASRRSLIDRVLVAPEYVDRVLSAKSPNIRQLEPLREPAWVRHGEHVHIDFRLGSR